MKNMFKKFGTSLKNYFSYVMKASFGELMIHFVELVIVVLIALLASIPVGAVKGIMWEIVMLIIKESSYSITSIYNILFLVIEFIASFLVFVWLFNKRYEALNKELEAEKNEAKDKKNINKEANKKSEDPEIDLPKMKEE